MSRIETNEIPKFQDFVSNTGNWPANKMLIEEMGSPMPPKLTTDRSVVFSINETTDNRKLVDRLRPNEAKLLHGFHGSSQLGMT